MRILLSSLAIAFTVGCGGGYKVSESKALEAKLGVFRSAQLEASSGDAETHEAVEPFKTKLFGELTSRGVFTNYSTGLDAGDSEIRLSVVLTGLKTVSATERAMFGGMAGKARLTAAVTLTHLKTNQELGAFTITGKSSGGSVAAGGTSEAIDMTAIGVAEFLEKHK